MTPATTFAATYAQAFADSYPHLPSEKSKDLIAKATEAALKNIRGVIIDSPAFKLTCKRLGIKNTHAAIESYLNSDPSDSVAESAQYRVQFDEKMPVLITRIFTMKDGEKIKHTLNIEYAEAKAIAEAFNASMGLNVNQFACIHNVLRDAYHTTTKWKMHCPTLPGRDEFSRAMSANHERDLLVAKLVAAIDLLKDFAPVRFGAEIENLLNKANGEA